MLDETSCTLDAKCTKNTLIEHTIKLMSKEVALVVSTNPCQLSTKYLYTIVDICISIVWGVRYEKHAIIGNYLNLLNSTLCM